MQRFGASIPRITASAFIDPPKGTAKIAPTTGSVPTTRQDARQLIREQHIKAATIVHRDVATQATCVSVGSRVLDRFCQLCLTTEGAHLDTFSDMRDWCDVAARTDLSDVVTPYELLLRFSAVLAQFYRVAGFHERTGGAADGSSLEYQLAAATTRVAQLEADLAHTKEAAAKDKRDAEVATRERIRFEVANALQQNQKAGYLLNAKELTTLRADCALARRTIGELRTDVVGKDATIASLESDVDQHKDHIQTLEQSFAALHIVIDQNKEDCAREIATGVRASDAVQLRLSGLLLEQSERTCRYTSEILAMKIAQEERLAAQRACYQKIIDELKDQLAKHEAVASDAEKRLVEMTALYGDTAHRQSNVLRQMARNNMMLVEKQYSARTVHMRVETAVADSDIPAVRPFDGPYQHRSASDSFVRALQAVPKPPRSARPAAQRSTLGSLFNAAGSASVGSPRAAER